MDEKSSQQGQNVYAIIFTVIAVLALIGLVLMLFLRVQADDTDQTVTTASAPVVEAMTVYDLLDEVTGVSDAGGDTFITGYTEGGGVSLTTNDVVPTENAQNNLWTAITASDQDGCEEIDDPTNYAGQYRLEGILCDEANKDGTFCYPLDSDADTFDITGCTPGGADKDVEVEVNPFQVGDGLDSGIYYFAMPTDAGSPSELLTWEADFEVIDSSASTLSEQIVLDFELASLTALDVDATIDYGTVQVAALPSTTEQSITFQNTGNRVIDMDFLADGDLVCDGTASNNIPAGNAVIGADVSFLGSEEAGTEENIFTAGGTYQELDANASDDGYADENEFSAGLATAFWDPVGTGGTVVPSEIPAYTQLFVQDAGLTGNISGTCSNTITFSADLGAS